MKVLSLSLCLAVLSLACSHTGKRHRNKHRQSEQVTALSNRIIINDLCYITALDSKRGNVMWVYNKADSIYTNEETKKECTKKN